jgi:hypothetical protein
MANLAQRQWMKTISEWHQSVGFIDHSLNGCEFQLHHVAGRKFKHNKIAIGEWFILPLPFVLHDVSSGSKLNVTHYKHRFTEVFGLQSELFKQMIDSMVEYGAELPFGQDVINAIMDTRK